MDGWMESYEFREDVEEAAVKIGARNFEVVEIIGLE
jgi:hypothetical protein